MSSRTAFRGGIHGNMVLLPESLSQDRDRCRAAGISDDVGYRQKSEIALELYDRVRGNGVTFEWMTFDEWY